MFTEKDTLRSPKRVSTARYNANTWTLTTICSLPVH